MDVEDKNQQLVQTSANSIVLSRPGQLLTRMTVDLIPLAHVKKIHDDRKAEPSFSKGIEAFAKKDFQAAICELTKAAELGHRLAQFKLAIIYLDGVEGEKNYALAYLWFHRAAEQGDADSLNKLGWMCEAGFGVERDQARAVNWFRQAAERGHLEAQFNLAAKYDNGEGVSQNHAEAARWYRLAAEQGLADARYFLALALETGEGVPVNIEEAIDWYILASEQGHRSAKLTLWGHALAGRYLPEDDVEKIFVEGLGVEMRYPLAEYKYAYRLLVGDGVPKNIELSMNLYQRAAKSGFVPAGNHIALVYSLSFVGLKSINIDPNWRGQKSDLVLGNLKPNWIYLESGSADAVAVTRFREHRIKAEGGDEDAISDLACDYYFGHGTSVNLKRALEWVHKGVKVNDVYCHYLFGYMLKFGIETPRDEKSALMHLKKAAKLGHVSAARLAAELLLEGNNDTRKGKQAIKMLTDLAEDGDAASQFDLGYLYSKGERVSVSHEKAVFWYSKAADQGHTAALFNLAVRYEYEQGVTKDWRLALTLYKRSAEGGFIHACEELIKIYKVGRLGEQCNQEAERWASEANRLKIETDKVSVQNQTPNLAYLGASRRQKRLEHKRSLQRKASEMLGKD